MAKPKAATPAPTKSITSYKGFGPDWKCRDFQYAVGQTYEMDGAKACEYGFHACEHPLNVFDYYAPAGNKFAVVEQSGTLSRHDGDTKVASSKITIKAEIGIPGLVQAAIEWVSSRCEPIDPKSPASSTGTRGAASSTGDYGAASSTGDYGAASSTGYQGAASSTGYQGAASSTGTRGAAMACGKGGRAMGADGNALFLVHRNDDYEITHARALIVGRDGIKAAVWYSLDDAGNAVEAEDQS